MSYFDHVQCSSCGARMNPEQLSPGRGEMPACPYCNANLNLADLFGVKDSFVGMHDDEGNDHSLDDLVGGELFDNRYADGRAPAPTPPPARPAPRAASRVGNRPTARSGQRAPSGAAGRANAMVPRSQPAPADPPASTGGQPSAMDLLREMKKKR